MLRFGPDHGPVAILTLPLLDEANRTRRLAVRMLQRLADHGIGGLLPDVPGQGESLAPLASHRILADALAALSQRCLAEGRRTYGIGIRSGALLDSSAKHTGRWHLTPQTGAELLREWHRLWLAAGHRGSQEAMSAGDAPVEIAGHRVPVALLASLIDAQPAAPRDRTYRVVRLSGDTRVADRLVEAAPPWRRTEPGDDVALATLLADDIATWIAACEA
ncbi:hypothetical protein D9601_03910 [Sphingomonas sp. MA1305]|uniref:hypothetical protein n=1 Tax=Sphingomonas sp. MA1305 TaxID=2479204 RepID=UPI0018DF7623|nr:hypothetical protein [Sphingomonas sp. MA1305]MBI0474507.1 hypothetical protein [Sphingomonas sp. MA1305]